MPRVSLVSLVISLVALGVSVGMIPAVIVTTQRARSAVHDALGVAKVKLAQLESEIQGCCPESIEEEIAAPLSAE